MQKTSEDTPKETRRPPHYYETMIYHTTTRNVGIYTSLSLVALGTARAMLTNKRDMVAAVFCMCSGLFLYLAMDLNTRLLWPSTSAAAAPTSKRVPIVLAVVHILMFIVLIVATWRGITTFRRRQTIYTI